MLCLSNRLGQFQGSKVQFPRMVVNPSPRRHTLFLKGFPGSDLVARHRDHETVRSRNCRPEYISLHHRRHHPAQVTSGGSPPCFGVARSLQGRLTHEQRTYTQHRLQTPDSQKDLRMCTTAWVIDGTRNMSLLLKIRAKPCHFETTHMCTWTVYFFNLFGL